MTTVRFSGLLSEVAVNVTVATADAAGLFVIRTGMVCERPNRNAVSEAISS